MVRLKVPADQDSAAWINKFQFLMVRLKAFSKAHNGVFNLVSIPYGSIKSIDEYISDEGVSGFQFLMVRLKVHYRFVGFHHFQCFNSLWFD